MDKMIEYVKKNNIEYTKNLITEPELYLIKIKLNLSLGEQLKKYILNFGYLGYESVEFYGINSKQGLESDMLVQTLYLRQHFNCTKKLIALENIGEGEYILVDSYDNIYQFILGKNEVKDIKLKFNDYIMQRLKEEIEKINNKY